MESEKKAKFSKILVAIDGSDHSMKAAEYAIDIARDNKSQLIALTVLDIAKVGYAASSFITSPMYGLNELQRKRKQAQEWLEQVSKMTAQKSTTADNSSIQFTSQIEESMSIAGSIVDYADNHNIDNNKNSAQIYSCKSRKWLHIFSFPHTIGGMTLSAAIYS